MADIEFIVTKQVPQSNAVAVAAIQTPEISQESCIDIADVHSAYRENIDESICAVGDNVTPYIGYSSVSGPNDWQVVVTDKVLYSGDDHRSMVLLPYQYQLKYDHYDTSDNPAGSIKVCYLNGDEVTGASFAVEYGDRAMWDEYEALGSSMRQRYNMNIVWSTGVVGTSTHRVRVLLPEQLCFTDTTYCIKYNRVIKVSSGAGVDPATDVEFGYVEIINPCHMYRYGVDYEYSGGKVIRKGGGSLPESGAYCKRASINRIRVMHGASNPLQGWYLRVWCGSFRRKVGDNTYTYEVPECHIKQPAAIDWSTNNLIDPRCSYIELDNCGIMDSYTISVSERMLHVSDSGYPNYVPYNIHHKILNPISGVGSNPSYSSGINIYIDNKVQDNGIIRDIDLWNGIVVLNSPVDYGNTVSATYVHRQLYWTMQLPDLCPHVNHSLLNCNQVSSTYLGYNDAVVICVLPAGYYSKSNESIVWYLKSENPNDTYNGSYRGYSSVRYSSVPTSPDVVLVNGTIKLAEVSIRYFNSTDAEVYDARIRGGGLKPDAVILSNNGRPRQVINLESNYYADIGLLDGQGLRETGIVLIKVPRSKVDAIINRIKATDGSLSTTDAYRSAIEIIKKHIDRKAPAGIYYVLIDENNNIYELSR